MSDNKEKTVLEQKREELLYAPKNGYDRISGDELQACRAFCDRYIDFMNKAKTEREAVVETVRLAELAGFKPFIRGQTLLSGDKVYRVNRDKSVIFAVIGKKTLANGANIAAAHIDSPRLDLKPNPLYEDSELAFFKTHYYGGIKKYQWTTIPLALHGVVVLKDGSVLDVRIGEEKDDPVFTITDLLIHLAADQMKKTISEGITGEGLNAITGSRPVSEEGGSEKVKLAVMMLLNEKYGITEEDFISSELSLVPAFEARYVGLDKSLIGAYGHDDRVCSFTAFDALMSLEEPLKTSVCVLADKEEIGSCGTTGMKSEAFDTFMSDLCDAQNTSRKACFEKSVCLSADVTNAFDPIYPEVSEKRNNARLNYGVCIMKYTGSKGKSGSSDAPAELMAKLRMIFDEEEVAWQTAELGKVDQGGGGTIAAYMANRNIDTVDAGVPVLSMHSPFEVAAAFDIFMSYKATRSLYLSK